MSAPLPTVLLYEPQFVLRRTVAAAARQLGLADVHEAATLQAAFRLAGQRAFDLAVVALDADPPAELRRFAQACGAARLVGLDAPGASSPTAATTAAISAGDAAGVPLVLHRPLKVKELLRHLGR